ncbi:hypothetical protein C8Q74DRAFT_1258355 [Fomes fomentarius]|nr:hypothetical protein C8Q74DRAFT_1258355 [Fomes fomentarius]
MGEDTEFLSYDPTRRDKLIAELYATEGVRPQQYADQIVPPGGDPDEYLRSANTAIAELTPPKSFEERLVRLHIAFPALQVFNQFKFGYALLDHNDLARQVMRRQTALMNDWAQNEYPRLFPDRVKPNGQVLSTPRNDGRLITPPATLSPKVLSAEEIAEFLDSPHTLLGKRLQHSPPPDEYQDIKGKWEMASYTRVPDPARRTRWGALAYGTRGNQVPPYAFDAGCVIGACHTSPTIALL